MRLAIADPPYLGRAQRWYGTGRGSAAGRHRADTHPEAHAWDNPQTHVQLCAQLRSFDGFACALTPSSLPLYLAELPDVHVMAWVRHNAPPCGHRLTPSWEPVLVRIPAGRAAHGTGPARRDVLVANAPRAGFAGSKPAPWTRWVLDAMGYREGDTVDDLFPGSGAVSAELSQQVLL